MLPDKRTPEFPYTETDFRQIAGMIYDEAGIFLPETKMNLVYSRLARRLRTLKMRSFHDYILYVRSDRGREERRHLTNALTTNLTHFFREPHHFKTISAELAQEALTKTARGGRYRIWSAGCSTGEEPYSMAISLLSVVPELLDRDVKILATDIDSEAVDKAIKGAYDKEIINPVEPALRHRFFETGWGPNADRYVVNDQLRSMVSFKTLNLMTPWPMRFPFDAIMCRNVVIYFDEQTKSVLWQRFADQLAPGGWLFIGHSERVHGGARDCFDAAGLTTYRKVG